MAKASVLVSSSALIILVLAVLHTENPAADTEREPKIFQHPVPAGTDVPKPVVLPPAPALQELATGGLEPARQKEPEAPESMPPAQPPTAFPDPAPPSVTTERAPEPLPDPKQEADAAPAIRARPAVEPVPEMPAIGPEAAATSSPASAAKPETIVDRAAVAEGRVLLRLIAEGKGPDIAIGWPSASGDRDQLYLRLTRCYGMTSAVMDGEGRLFVRDGPSGQAWAPNRDRYSDFLRVPDGHVPKAERREESAIKAHHGVRGRLVRIFPRIVDAGIVGALLQVSGRPAHSGVPIRARYLADGQGLKVIDILVGGHAIEQSIRVPVFRRLCNA